MLQKIKLSLIRQDGGTQAREKMNPEAIKEYSASMLDGVEFPPVVLFHDGSTYWLGDGFHRVAAAIEAKQKAIAAEVHDGGFRDAILYAVGANASHGLRRTNADKRRSVSRLLDDQEWSQWSNREIARRCGVSDPFVMQMRSEMVLTVSTPKVSSDDTPKAKPEPAKASPEAQEAEPITTAEQVRDLGREVLAQDKSNPKVLTDTKVLSEGFEPKHSPDDRDARIAELTRLLAERDAEIVELKRKLEEACAQVQEISEDNDRMHRILDAEDLLKSYQTEVKRASEQARVNKSRNDGLMVENHDLATRLKSALRKIERMGKTPAGQGAIEPQTPTEEDDYNATFGETG